MKINIITFLICSLLSMTSFADEQADLIAAGDSLKAIHEYNLAIEKFDQAVTLDS
ncbi:MAG: hypothetical protein GY839_10450, partial [candidate division Zixibacteria bacterium]|nr:hypothetical protein [candidate division Zixibacteria bacterium]